MSTRPTRTAPAAEVAAGFTRGALRRCRGAAPLRRRRRRRHLRVREYPGRRSPRWPRRRRCTRRRARSRSRRTGWSEKQFVAGLGGRPAPVRGGRQPRPGSPRRWREIGAPAILKTRRFGYDGKGQARIERRGRGGRGLGGGGRRALGPGRLRPLRRRILDPAVPRRGRRSIVTWDAPRNVHEDGILDTLDRAGRARHSTRRSRSGRGARRSGSPTRSTMSACWRSSFSRSATRRLFNEMAPRVHNSGHWTIEGALTSQFENHIRAICGLPLGSTTRTAPRVEMRNLIGDDADRLARAPRRPGRPSPSLRQERGPARPQDGPRHAPAPQRLSPRRSPGEGSIVQRRAPVLTARGAPPSLAPCRAASSPRSACRALRAAAGRRRVADHHPDEIVRVDQPPRGRVQRLRGHRRDSGRPPSPNNCRGGDRARCERSAPSTAPEVSNWPGSWRVLPRDRSGCSSFGGHALRRQEAAHHLPIAAAIDGPVWSAWTGAVMM